MIKQFIKRVLIEILSNDDVQQFIINIVINFINNSNKKEDGQPNE